MMSFDKFSFKAVLFDFDGTLTEPGALDFAAIREAMGCPPDQAILEFIDTFEGQPKQQHIIDILDEFEMAGARESVPNPDAEAIIRYLRTRHLPIGIITRNGIKPIMKAFENFHALQPDDFDLIISRDDPVRPKPSPEGIFLAAGKLDVKPEEILVVGDYIHDIQAGNRAGAVTVLLCHPERPLSFEADSDYQITHLRELKNIVRLGLPLSCGKFPGDLLSPFLEQLDLKDPSLLISPGIGEDTAAVDIEGEEVLVLKSDPITFVSSDIGHYAVLINANDIATSGARPRWFLASLLFPPGVTPLYILQVMNELKETCRKWAITLCGGHTEITDAVTRPVISGMLAGTIERDALVDKRRMQKGDLVLLTKKLPLKARPSLPMNLTSG
jgi:hydrogenase expression/formation protein HypE